LNYKFIYSKLIIFFIKILICDKLKDIIMGQFIYIYNDIFCSLKP
jgi:hypothetical protein